MHKYAALMSRTKRSKVQKWFTKKYAIIPIKLSPLASELAFSSAILLPAAAHATRTDFDTEESIVSPRY